VTAGAGPCRYLSTMSVLRMDFEEDGETLGAALLNVLGLDLHNPSFGTLPILDATDCSIGSVEMELLPHFDSLPPIAEVQGKALVIIASGVKYVLGLCVL
jgi:hypothetical protein